MTVWQKISGLATAVGEAGGSLLGELGAVLGLDTSRRRADPLASLTFTIAVIALCAKMAKADGMVASAEIEAFREVFNFSPQEARNVERVYALAKQDVAGYEVYADQIARLLKDDRKLLQHVLEGLMHVAAADGLLHPAEDTFLHDVARRFGFAESEYRYFRARFVTDQTSPFDVLRLAPDASNEQIKAQYRKLLIDNHPDKLMGRGVPAEFIDIATRKVAAINAAYAQIARERGL
jgi:DnaJ like chaperone protein